MLKHKRPTQIAVREVTAIVIQAMIDFIKHLLEGLRLAKVTALRIQRRPSMNTPRMGINIPEHPNHDAIHELLDTVRMVGVIHVRRQALAVMTLERRNAHRAIEVLVPDYRAECTDMGN